MTITRLWAQKNPKCFDPQNDTLLLDFELYKSEATELLRDYFEYWEDDEYNQKVIEVCGGAYPHFDCWWDDHNYDDSQLQELSMSDDEEDVLIAETCALAKSLEQRLASTEGELFMEVQ